MKERFVIEPLPTEHEAGVPVRPQADRRANVAVPRDVRRTRRERASAGACGQWRNGRRAGGKTSAKRDAGRRGTGSFQKGTSVHEAYVGRKRRSRKLFVTTDTLDNDIAALATIGESSQPVNG